MRDFIKTWIVTGIVLLCMVVAFFIASNLEQGIEMLTRTELPFSDPDVKLNYDKIANNSDLRRAKLDVNDLTDPEIYKLVIDNLTKDDYSKKTIKADKIVCQVTKKVFFYTDDKECNIRIIKTELFNKYIKDNYNLDKEIEFTNFNYGGYDCRLDGKKYYCEYTSSKKYVQGYSEFISAYKSKDTMVISEYYLQVDLSDGERCNTYFDEEYCADYKKAKRTDIDSKIIKRDGVIYEHVFSLVDGKYYLQQSYVKNEG
jgi:hypothetical protein